MFTLTFTKSSSKNYPKAVELAEDLGAVKEGQTVTLNLEKSELLFAYRLLFPLIEIIYKWVGTKATYNGKEVHPFRFIFNLWHNVADCAAGMNKEGSPAHCQLSPSEKGWGCKFLSSVKRHLSGTGNYEKGFPFWYNYGWFDLSGDWIIDKDAVWHKLKNEITGSGLDACPFFSEKKVKNEVYNELPDRIIIDHVTFRAHFDVRYEGGERKIIPVNIRHVGDPLESYRQREKKLISGIGRSLFYGVNELEMPPGIINKNRRLSDKLEVLKDTDKVVRVFEDGICKN